MTRPAIVAVVGATATGKTRVAIELARRLRGEVVNADSRQVYRGMDIGTAKPTAEEQAAVPHRLLDVADPDDPMTLARFLDLAHAALADAWSRSLVPVVAGGTGQYVWALLEGWTVPRVAPDRALRAELEALAAREGPGAIAAMLREVDPESAESIDRNNVRRLIRAIEVTRATGRPFSAWRRSEPPEFDAHIIGLRLERGDLYRRIDARVDRMIDAGLVDEVRRLERDGYGGDLPALASIGYREVCAHLRGEMSLSEASERIKQETHRLARMQHTWFRAGDERIQWVDADAPDLMEQALATLPAGLRGRLSDAGSRPVS
jgi:tRNA dimethylallyltransferase